MSLLKPGKEKSTLNNSFLIWTRIDLSNLASCASVWGKIHVGSATVRALKTQNKTRVPCLMGTQPKQSC